MNEKKEEKSLETDNSALRDLARRKTKVEGKEKGLERVVKEKKGKNGSVA